MIENGALYQELRNAQDMIVAALFDEDITGFHSWRKEEQDILDQILEGSN